MDKTSAASDGLIPSSGNHDALSAECSATLATTSSVSKASARSVTVNLITGGFGIGMFSLPWSTAGTSLMLGVATIVLTVLVNFFTIVILIEGAEKYQAFDLGALLSYLPSRISKIAQAVTNIAVWCVLFLGQVGYINIMSDALMSVSDGTPLYNTELTKVLASLLVLPLCFFDQRYLSFTSTLAVIVNIYIFLVMAAQPKNPDGMCFVGIGTGFVSMISVMMQSVVVQMCVLPMYQELEDRSPQKFRRVLTHSFGTLTLIFSAFAVVGYVTYGSGVKGNILDSLPTTAWGKAGKVGAGLSVAGVYPIFEQAMVAPVWNLQSSNRRVLYVLASLTTMFLILLAALRFDDISSINVYSGALVTIAFVALVPGVVGLFLLDRSSRRWRASMYTLLIGGITAGTLGMWFTDNYSQELADHCAWKA